MTKRTIPELRDALGLIADALEARPGLTCSQAAHDLRGIIKELYRRSPARRAAPVKHGPLTDEQKATIKEFAFSTVGMRMHLQEIANHFNTNIGRVSEAVHDL